HTSVGWTDTAGFLVNHPVRRLNEGLRREERTPHQHFPEHDSGRKNVGLWRRLLSQQDFRRSIRNGSRETVFIDLCTAVLRVRTAGQPEITYFHFAGKREQNIFGFDIPVNNLLSVRGLQRLKDLDSHGKEILGGKC